MRFLKTLILSASSLAIAMGAAADEKFALIIGNAEYTAESLPPLLNPVNDATLMAEKLTTLGFEVDLVVDADQTAMKRAIQRLGENLREAGPDATGMFYFSGHGFQVSGLNYLAPLKANLRTESDADIEAVQADWVLAQMESAGNAVNIVVLDACRNTRLLARPGPPPAGLRRSSRHRGASSPTPPRRAKSPMTGKDRTAPSPPPLPPKC